MAATYLMSLNSKFTFGKYKGFTLEDILNTDPKYVRWCIGDATLSLVIQHIKSINK